MKKLFICFTASLALISSLAMAKTEGNSAQLNLINTATELSFNNSTIDGNDLGIGVTYKNTIALGNNIYVAPGVLLDYNNSDISDTTVFGGQNILTSLETEYSYGFGVDIGCELNNQISAFINISYLEARVGATSSSNGNVLVDTRQTDEGISYGLGAEYAIDKQISAVLSYNTTELTDSFDIETIKLGVSYDF